MTRPALCSIETSIEWLLDQENIPVSTPAGDYLANLPRCSHGRAIVQVLESDSLTIPHATRKVLSSIIKPADETAKTLAVTMPWFTCIMEIKLGELAYVVVQAGDFDAAEDAAIDAAIEQHDIAEDKHESLSCIGIFEGAAPCLKWEA